MAVNASYFLLVDVVEYFSESSVSSGGLQGSLGHDSLSCVTKKVICIERYISIHLLCNCNALVSEEDRLIMDLQFSCGNFSCFGAQCIVSFFQFPDDDFNICVCVIHIHAASLHHDLV